MNHNFPRYIFISVVSHLLLTVLLYMSLPYMKPPSSVFNVDIVIPEEILKLPSIKPDKPALTKKKPALSRKKTPLVRRKQLIQEKEVAPDSFFGDGTGLTEREGKTAESQSSSKKEITGEETAGKKKRPALKEQDSGKSVPGNGTGEDSRAFLFDKKTIEKYARKGSKPAKKGLSFDATGFKNRGYMRSLKERIESIWKYPKEAARHGISGDLFMKFTITREGKLGEVELIRTSGYRALDEAAMKAVKKAEPFWPLPDDWPDDSLEIRGHFIYVFGNTIVM